MKITLSEIDKFIKEHRISDATFSSMAGLCPSWVCKLRLKRLDPDSEIPGNASTLKGVSDILSGKKAVPASAPRRSPKKPGVVTFPQEYDVTHLIEKVYKSGKSITFEQFRGLCSADWKLNNVITQLGIEQG